MLSIPPDVWPERVRQDRVTRHFYKGNIYSFDELAALRRDEKLAEQCTTPLSRERHARCQAAIRRLGDYWEAHRPGAAVVVGNDQMEVFTSDHVPAFAVFWGAYVEGIPRTAEFLAKLPPGIACAEMDRTPPEYTQYPCLPVLGRYLIESLIASHFDVAQMTRLTTGEIGSNAVPHAWGFVYRRILRDRVVPHVPVFVNTFYPPNQPTAARCFSFGRALGRAIAAWPEEREIAVIASGGLTHWVVCEAFDRMVLESLERNDAAALSCLPEDFLQQGTSEIKNWITVAGVMAEAGLRMTLVDYVPCYRSEAGTGNAMGFAYWQ
jgi:3-O-methylgallate 3,4-dioxygenase